MSTKHPRSAAGKPTALTPKNENAQHKIESRRTEQRSPVKAGRNMGGRDITGARTRPT